MLCHRRFRDRIPAGPGNAINRGRVGREGTGLSSFWFVTVGG